VDSTNKPIRVLIWDENPPHAPKALYPKSLNGALADGIGALVGAELEITCANLDDPEQGCSQAALDNADVLLWWGHARHGEVTEETARRVMERVHKGGMGFIALHSAHYAKTFQWVMACPGHLKGGWREMNPMEPEEICVCAPWHPIAEGIEDFTLDGEEMYGSPFDVPPALTLVLQSHFPYDGKTFPSGIAWTVGDGKDPEFTSGPGQGVGEGMGAGRVFYFRPGHETCPTYHNPIIHKILANAVRWCAKRS
jgi:trehalose utilization protein